VDVVQGLVIALAIAGLIVCGVLVFALFETVKTLRSVREVSDELAERLPGLMEKTDVLIDAANAELLRVDAIIDDLEDISSKVGHTVTVVQGAVKAPADAVNIAGERIRAAWRKARRTRAAVHDVPPDH